MRGFDSNVLVRYLVKDDPAQSVIVDRLIHDTLAEDTVVFLAAIVLCETVWVLAGGYGYSKAEIAEAIEKLLLTQQFDFDARDDVWRALERFRSGKADFADYLIGVRNQSSGCAVTVTFDQALREEDGFELLTAG